MVRNQDFDDPKVAVALNALSLNDGRLRKDVGGLNITVGALMEEREAQQALIDELHGRIERLERRNLRSLLWLAAGVGLAALTSVANAVFNALHIMGVI